MTDAVPFDLDRTHVDCLTGTDDAVAIALSGAA